MAPIESAMTLPDVAFTSDDWLTLEIERVFAPRWTAVLFDSVIPDAGDAHPFELFGMPLVAVRGQDGAPRVFHNICPYDGCLVVQRAAHGSWGISRSPTTAGATIWRGA